MPFTVNVVREERFVRFDVAGHATLVNYFDLIDQAARITTAEGQQLAMVDLRGVQGRLQLTDQMFIGEVVGQKLQHLHKLASLVPDPPESYHSPKVAVKKGVNIRSFGDEADAIAWLRDDQAS